MLKPARALLGEGGEVVAIHVVAREELSPSSDAILATDPERDDIRRALTPDTADAYGRQFAEWREWLAREWRAAGAQYEMTVTDEAPERVIRRIARGEREDGAGTMTFLAPVFLAAGAAVAGAIVLLHFLARRRPRPAVLPTARFVPDRPARWPSRAPRPTDLLLLALRVLAIVTIAAAFAGPIRAPRTGSRRPRRPRRPFAQRWR